MANMFRSNNVYKKLSDTSNGKNSLIPVRGLYVGGDTKISPTYIDNMIFIKDIKTKKAKVVDYFEKSVDLIEESSVSLISFNTTPLVSVHFRVREKILENDSVVSLINLEVGNMNVSKIK